MKLHLNFDVRDLGRSIEFYRTLLNQQPVKRYDDYALFITENPGLELALDLAENPQVGTDAHFGIVVQSENDVRGAARRLTSAGFASDIEADQTCCYARQTKVWTTDPDGRRWETYVVHEDTAQRHGSEGCCEREEALR